MKSLSPSDWVQICGIIASVITSVVAIIISIRALQTTKKSIDEANRPYIVAYLNWNWLDQNLQEYLVIKNFGNIGGTIDHIDYSEPWINAHNKKPIFDSMDGYFIAPGQRFVSLSEVDATGAGHERARKKPIKMTIHYSWPNHTDLFSHEFSPDVYTQFETSRRTSGFRGEEKDIEELIYRIAHEAFRRNM